jgi:hypothetical protein
MTTTYTQTTFTIEATCHADKTMLNKANTEKARVNMLCTTAPASITAWEIHHTSHASTLPGWSCEWLGLRSLHRSPLFHPVSYNRIGHTCPKNERPPLTAIHKILKSEGYNTSAIHSKRVSIMYTVLYTWLLRLSAILFNSIASREMSVQSDLDWCHTVWPINSLCNTFHVHWMYIDYLVQAMITSVG